MISVSIDPSQTRHAAPRTRPAAALARTIFLAIVGVMGIAGFSVAAYSALGKLAGPQVTKVAYGHKAADWPDLKDGVPALAPSADTRPVLRTGAVESVPSNATRPEQVASTAPARRNLPPIEVAPIVRAVPTASLIAVARTAALIPPRASETVRARAVEATLAALPPAATPRPARKPAAVAARARVAPSPEAAAAEAAPAEAEETEVLGVKVPSLASSGRKLVEGVRSLGDAVAEQF